MGTASSRGNRRYWPTLPSIRSRRKSAWPSVPGVFLDHVHEHLAERDDAVILALAGLLGGDVETRRLRDEPLGEPDLRSPRIPGLRDHVGVGHGAVEVAAPIVVRAVVPSHVLPGHHLPEPAPPRPDGGPAPAATDSTARPSGGPSRRRPGPSISAGASGAGRADAAPACRARLEPDRPAPWGRWRGRRTCPTSRRSSRPGPVTYPPPTGTVVMVCAGSGHCASIDPRERRLPVVFCCRPGGSAQRILPPGDRRRWR